MDYEVKCELGVSERHIPFGRGLGRHGEVILQGVTSINLINTLVYKQNEPQN